MLRRKPSTALLLTAALVCLGADDSSGLRTDSDGVPLVLDDRPIECPTDAADGKLLLSWPESGHRRERGSCQAGLAVDSWTAWYDNRVKSWTATLEDGQLVGRFRSWYESGQKQALLTYAEGLLHGDTTLWWPDGTLRAVGSYEAGLEQGCHTTWYPDGRLASKGAWLDGQKVGRWLHWDEQGARSKEQHEGRPSMGRCWWPPF
jgi:hypothetical protein